jgi:hypothetical protein
LRALAESQQNNVEQRNLLILRSEKEDVQVSTEADIQARLVAINDHLTKWREDVYRETQIAWNRQDDPESMRRARSAGITNAGPDPTGELYTLLDELGSAYLDSTADERVSLRNMLADTPTVLFEMYDYIRRTSKLLEDTENPNWLRLGLAAASLEDGRVDYRDLLEVLSDLYVAAVRASIDPRPYFQSVSRISSVVERHNSVPTRHPVLGQLAQPITAVKELIFGNDSTQAMLANFHKYEVYRREVKPKLRG